MAARLATTQAAVYADTVVKGSRKPPIKLGFAPGAVLLHGVRSAVDRDQQRTSVMAMRLRIQEMQLERARLLAEEREKDRELARFRIEERRRLREDTDERARLMNEDAELEEQLETGLARTRERIQKGERDLKSAVDEQASGGGMSPEDKRIAEEISQVLSGTWEPPKGWEPSK